MNGSEKGGVNIYYCMEVHIERFEVDITMQDNIDEYRIEDKIYKFKIS